MKSFNKIIFSFAALTAAVGFTSCQDDFEDKKPGLEIPEATISANTTIMELKQLYWQNPVNYIDTIGTLDNGDHYVIAGRVVSSDRAGNVYKKLVIQDGTAALALSINANSLYNDYRVGQEIVIDATGMYIGKYNGTQQLGFPMFYEKGQVWEATFMPKEFFVEHSQLNGLPEPSKIDTLVIRKFSELPSDPSQLAYYQSRLVRFNNVHFADGGEKQFTNAYKETTNRILYDADNQSITVRTSGYATFREEMLPAGNGDVVAILDYYATSDDPESPWQLTIIDANGCMNFGNPTLQPGGDDNPYTVTEVIELEDAGKTDRAWMTGYIVGAVAPEVETVTSDNDIEWSAEVVLANTLVIAATPDCTDWRQCIVVALPQDSPLRETGNLRDNPANYKKQIWLFGSFETFMGTWGLTGNSGATSQFRIEGVENPGSAFPAGDGTEASPFNTTQVIALNPTSTTEAPAGGTNVWIRGYIVGSMPTGGTSTTLSGTNFSTLDAAETNLVIGPTADCTDYTKCVGIQLPTGSIRTALNLKSNPGNLGRAVELNGDVMKYCGGPGLKNTKSYKLGEGGDTPVTPPTPSDGKGTGTKADPYDITKAIAVYNAGTVETAWIECYIVGSVPSQYYSDAIFGTESASASNVIVAASPSETSTDNCMPVQLPIGDVRNALSLQTNPGNLGKKVLLYGSIEKYFGVAGIKTVTEYAWVEGGDTPNPPTPPVTGDGNGSAESPYNISKAMSIFNAGTTETAWIEGYIVGTVPTQYYSDAVFGTENASNTNVLLAASASETDPANCMPVQLPTGDVRTALSLQTNPGNLGKHVRLYGSIEKYYGVAGIKTVTEYAWMEGGDTPTPPTPPATGNGDGSETSPYDIAGLFSVFNSGTVEKAWVKAYIVGTVPTQYYSDAVFGTESASNTNFIIAASPSETNKDNCVPVQLPTGDIRTALSLQANPGNLGKEIILYGSIEKYFGVAGLKSVTQFKWVN